MVKLSDAGFYFSVFVYVGSGAAKLFKGPPYQQLVKEGYPGPFLQALGGVMIAIGGAALINPVALYAAPSIMGGAIFHNAITLKKPVETALTAVRCMIRVV